MCESDRQKDAWIVALKKRFEGECRLTRNLIRIERNDEEAIQFTVEVARMHKFTFELTGRELIIERPHYTRNKATNVA